MRIIGRVTLFVGAVLLLALTAPSEGWWRGGTAATFYGNPNVTISNIAGSITSSRDSDGSTLQVPCFVQVSASAITASGTSRPYEDLSYSWNFGDASGTETFTRPTDGVVVNANGAQVGPDAFYVYRVANSYTIRLTASGHTSGNPTSNAFTKAVTCNAFDKSGGEFWADSTAGGTNSGTLANPYNTSAAVFTAMTSGSAKIMHVKKGSAFTATSAIAAHANPARWDTCIDSPCTTSYGSGANPTFTMNGSSGDPMFLVNNGSSRNDVVISNIDFIQNGSVGASAVDVSAGSANANTLKNYYFDNVNFGLTANTAANVVGLGSAQDNGPTSSNFGIWKGSITNSLSATNNAQGMYIASMNWFSIVGTTVSGAGHNETLDHHIYPNIKTHGLYQWNTFGQTGTSTHQRNFALNLNWDPPTGNPLEYAEYQAVTENWMGYTLRAIDSGNSSNSISVSQFRNLVISGNVMNGLTGNAILQMPVVSTFTLRYTKGCNFTAASWYQPAASARTTISVNAYYNKIAIPSGATTGADPDNSVIGYVPSVTWTQPQVFTNNIVQDDRAVPAAAALPFTQFPSNGTTWTANQYYAPNAGGASYLYNYDDSTLKTVAAWNTQMGGTDINSNPSWPSPSTCNFG